MAQNHWIFIQLTQYYFLFLFLKLNILKLDANEQNLTKISNVLQYFIKTQNLIIKKNDI